jgi:hypothetical protein
MTTKKSVIFGTTSAFVVPGTHPDINLICPVIAFLVTRRGIRSRMK